MDAEAANPSFDEDTRYSRLAATILKVCGPKEGKAQLISRRLAGQKFGAVKSQAPAFTHLLILMDEEGELAVLFVRK